jgi:hypothetical protein
MAGVTGFVQIRVPSGGGGLMDVESNVVAGFLRDSDAGCAVVISEFLSGE